ncbi:MAG: hypothetical protein V2A78_07255 [bacterium]
MSIISAIGDVVHKVATAVSGGSKSSSSSSTASSSSSSKGTSSSSSSSSGGSSSDRVTVSDQAKKDQERQRVEQERQDDLRKLDEERKAREKALEEEKKAKEKVLEEERQRKLKELEEEEAKKQEEIQRKNLSEDKKKAEEAKLKAEIEAKKQKIEAEAAAKKKALEEETTQKKGALAEEIKGKQEAVETEANQKMAQAAGPTLPPNFNEMSPEQQYNYLHDITVAMAGGDESAWKTGDKEVNLIGIRSWHDGQAGSAEGNTYNDTIYAVRMNNGKPEVYAFNATVDAGIDPGGTGYGYSDSRGSGYSHVADGYYADGTFVKSNNQKWGVRTVLAQAGNVNINCDYNNDGVIQDDERINKTEGAGWGIYFHPGGSGGNVNSWSAGCQVIRPEQYGTFMNLIEESPSNSFAYTLVDSKNLPEVDSNHVAVGVPNNPIVAEGSGGTSYTSDYTPATYSGGGSTAGGGYDSSGGTSGLPSISPPPLPASLFPPGFGPEGASPFGATNPLQPAAGITQENVDQQLETLCQAAIEESKTLLKTSPATPWGAISGTSSSSPQQMGPAMMTLYSTYAMVLMQKMTIKPETELLVTQTLTGAGINVPAMKQMLNQTQAGQAAASAASGATAAASTTTATATTTAAATPSVAVTSATKTGEAGL